MREVPGRVARWLGDNRAILVALGLAALLGRFLFDWTPDARPPRSMASPTVAATPVPVAIAYPTTAPTASPTVAPTAIAELRGAGQLLYTGSLNGRTGVFTINADGTGRRLLAEGEYGGAAWSPDGRRFVAYGGNFGDARLAFYDAEGRLLRRFPLTDRLPLVAYWAPDGQRVAVQMQSSPAGGVADRGQPATSVWLVDETGAVEINLGAQTSLASFSETGSWSVTGRLALVVYDDRDGDGRLTESDLPQLWSVDARGGDERLLVEGDFSLVAWSRDSTTLYALGGTERDASGRILVGTTQLLGINEHTGARRTITTFDDVARQLDPPLTPGETGSIPRGFRLATLAPAGDRFALSLFPATGPGGSGPWGAPYLVVLDLDGRLLWQTRLEERTAPAFTTWSPDGARLAYSYREIAGGARGGIAIANVAPDGDHAEPLTLDATDGTGGAVCSLRWSPDGRWLATLGAGKLEVMAPTAPARSWTLEVGIGGAARFRVAGLAAGERAVMRYPATGLGAHRFV